MGTWLKRNTSKKYVVSHEHESMDQILEGLIDSQQPEKVKDAIISRICEQGAQTTHPSSTVKGVFQVGCKWVLHGTTTLQVASGFKLLSTWGPPHLECFQTFFTPSLVAQMLTPGYGTDANIPLLIREGLRVMNYGGPYLYEDHAQVVQNGVTKFVCSTSDRLVVRNVGLLLKEFNECIPATENEVTNFCLAVLNHLSTGVLPQDAKEVLKFIRLTDEIAGFLSLIWNLRSIDLLRDCLAHIFRIIAAPRMEDPPELALCLAPVVKHVPIELANKVVKDVMTDPSVGEEAIEAAISQIVEWLKWPTAQNIDLWLSCFLTELAAAQMYTLLIRITEAHTEVVTENIVFPQLRTASFKILSQMLLSFQHSPGPFHKALDKMPTIIAALRREGTPQSGAWLGKVAKLIHCLMYQHTGFPELYDPILELIKDYPAPNTEEIKTTLYKTKWSSQVSGCVNLETTPVIPMVRQEKLETGKTGLENLGNTCYMNSILQALYMCDQFRRGVLSKCPSGREGLLVKLQHVFAMLSQSSRPAIAPSKFLQASRPPWFLPGHQQDCSEFLKYLLDQLHEDEKAAVASKNCGTIPRSPSSGSISPTGTGTIKLTRSEKKPPVLLMGMKRKTDDEINGIPSSECPADGNTCWAPHMSLVEKTFKGKVQTTLRCLACKQESKRVENFSDIPLAFPNSSSKSAAYPHNTLAGGSGVPGNGIVPDSPQPEVSCDKDTAQLSEDCFTLNDLISFYLKPEKMTGDNKYRCDSCGKLQDGERMIHIVESPKYLIFTLLRFSYDTKLQSRTKIFHDVRYPLTLAVPVCNVPSSCSTPSTPMKSHSRASSNGSSICSSDNNIFFNKDSPHVAKLRDIAQKLAPECETCSSGLQHCDLYGLSAVVVHSGTSSECGHYYCYARHSQAGQVDPGILEKVNGNLENLDLLPDKWYNFNDSRVAHANFESFSNVTKRFSKDTAYVLIYCKLEVGQSTTLTSEPPLRSDLRDSVVKDNEKYLEEQETEARLKEQQRRRSASVTSANFHNWQGGNDDDDDSNFRGGPPGCGGGLGGGMDTSGSRFVF